MHFSYRDASTPIYRMRRLKVKFSISLMPSAMTFTCGINTLPIDSHWIIKCDGDRLQSCRARSRVGNTFSRCLAGPCGCSCWPRVKTKLAPLIAVRDTTAPWLNLRSSGHYVIRTSAQSCMLRNTLQFMCDQGLSA